MRLEVVVMPVSDVDRAKRFYQALGWRQDADFTSGEVYRVVQMTPPGSQCSVIPVVYDIDAARDDLTGRGVEVSEVFHDVVSGFHHAGTEGAGGRTRPTGSLLRVLGLVQRPGRQRLAPPRDNGPAAWSVTGRATAVSWRDRATRHPHRR
jgi:catechol 2,3-dioxygenase-like lactoylglutathione lyase family enzyme